MLPGGTYLYANPEMIELAPARALEKKRILFPDSRGKRGAENAETGTIVRLLSDRYYFINTKSGDFCVASSGHYFAGIADWKIPIHRYCGDVVMSPLPPKRPFFGLFGRSMTFASLCAKVVRGDVISLKDRSIHKLLFKVALMGRTYSMPYMKAHVLRSVIDAFGYNFVCEGTSSDGGSGVFRVAWHRKKSAAIMAVRPCDRCDTNRIRISMENATRKYVAAGFVHYQPTTIEACKL